MELEILAKIDVGTAPPRRLTVRDVNVVRVINALSQQRIITALSHSSICLNRPPLCTGRAAVCRRTPVRAPRINRA